ncbi:MAG: SH3 domain-containing protein [Gemmobacter sp.]|nr:SH3 domain-containing protein [Gemmobacter sp.]
MLRMLLLLSAVLFMTLLVGGRDAGQLRPGLMAKRESAPDVQMPLPAQPEAAAYIPEPVRANSLPVVLPMASPAPSAAAADLAAPALTADTDTDTADLRYVTGRAVNVRGGPSTGHPVIGSLVQGEAVRIIHDSGNGWAHILIEGDGIDGYISTRFLSPETP